MGLQGRFEMILSKDELSRVNVEADGLVSPRVIIDVHGMSCREARRFINNIINVSRTECELTIIHGFNHGEAIRTMINNNFENNHILHKETDLFNQGRTHLAIA